MPPVAGISVRGQVKSARMLQLWLGEHTSNSNDGDDSRSVDDDDYDDDDGDADYHYDDGGGGGGGGGLAGDKAVVLTASCFH